MLTRKGSFTQHTIVYAKSIYRLLLLPDDPQMLASALGSADWVVWRLEY